MLIQIIFLSLVTILILFECNMICYGRFVNRPLKHYPKASVLIPCRNEAKRVRDNLLSLLHQDYPDFEVIVMDDESTDGTLHILKELEAKYAKLKVIQSDGLPPGWQGKNHACHKLAQSATGQWYLFVDADTHHDRQMLKRSIETVIQKKAALLSTFPQQKLSSWGDSLMVPLMPFVLLCYLPVYFVSRRTWKWAGSFSAACGQFLLFKRDAYEAVGGHEAIKGRISEAPLLAAAVKDKGEKILLMDGSPWVSCTMYEGLKDAFGGFSRSVFASMGGSVNAMTFFLVFQTLVFILPYGILARHLASPFLAESHLQMILAALLIPLWIRLRLHQRFRMSRWLVLLHVISVLMYHVVILNSFIHYRIRKVTSWKERHYVQPQS